MSAHMVCHEHIDVLVLLALKGPGGLAVEPDNVWRELQWTARPHRGPYAPEGANYSSEQRRIEHDALVEAGRTQDGRVSCSTVGQLLVMENIASLKDRYPEGRPGLGDWRELVPEWALEPYVFEEPDYRPTAIEGLSAIDGYEYQACEHDAWEGCEAQRFCETLRGALVGKLPGHGDGWSVSDEWLVRKRAERHGVRF